MEEFDAMMNCDTITTIRYVDDFLVLGPSAFSVQARFTAGCTLLKTMNMDPYQPEDGTGKAAKGETNKLFDFLGCEVSRSFIRPSRESRKRILEKVRDKFNAALRTFRAGRHLSPRSSQLSIVGTLDDVHNTVRSWSASYSFCNADQVLVSLDEKIDHEISAFIGEASRIRKQAPNPAASRRLLGVSPLSDGKKDPILTKATV